MNCTLRLFADDTKLYSAISNPTQEMLLQTNILKACDWANTWQMIFNIKKCKHCIWATKSKNDKRYVMKDADNNLKTITNVEKEKDLGVNISKEFKI